MTANPGGVETYLMNFFFSMNKDYRITFINIHPGCDIAYQKEILSHGGEVFLAENEYSLKSYFNRTKVARKILEKIDADIVYVNALTTNNAYWVKAAKILGVQAVYHSHNASDFFSSKLKKTLSTLLKPYNQKILKYATCLAASEESGVFMFNNKNATVIYNAIDSDKWCFNNTDRLQVRRDLEISDKQKVIIIVARLAEQKNIIRAIKIVKEVVERDKSYRCILVGDGHLKEQVIKEVKNLGLEDYVKMLGKRNDVPRLMSGSDILLLPSLFEGLPFVTIEAQGAGLPIVASKGVVPQIANITKAIFEISLEETNQIWAEKIIGVDFNNSSKRLRMNIEIKKSIFSMLSYDKEIKSVFNNLKG